MNAAAAHSSVSFAQDQGSLHDGGSTHGGKGFDHAGSDAKSLGHGSVDGKGDGMGSFDGHAPMSEDANRGDRFTVPDHGHTEGEGKPFDKRNSNGHHPLLPPHEDIDAVSSMEGSADNKHDNAGSEARPSTQVSDRGQQDGKPSGQGPPDGKHLPSVNGGSADMSPHGSGKDAGDWRGHGSSGGSVSSREDAGHDAKSPAVQVHGKNGKSLGKGKPNGHHPPPVDAGSVNKTPHDNSGDDAGHSHGIGGTNDHVPPPAGAGSVAMFAMAGSDAEDHGASHPEDMGK
ncbi:hypothetical protein BBJ28_00015569 [Nothophytophthora sp. Chile5]|nr:hypothetical protein BBJ28_00015569 [Nothophytophthora sp. Chile5]